MNELISKLFKQSGGIIEIENGNFWTYTTENYDPELFAKLIVRECIGICKGKTDHLDPNMYEVWRGALACASDIKVHFGVEE